VAPKSQPVRPSNAQAIKNPKTLTDEELIDFDTVNSSSGDTAKGSLSDLSGSSILSTSDSGRLVPVVPRVKSPGESSGGSTINLEVESGFRMPKRPGDSSATSGRGIGNAAGAKSQPGAAAGKTSAADLVNRRNASRAEAVRRAAQIDKARQTGATQPLAAPANRNQLSKTLIIGLTIMFVLAVALGFWLAKVTSG
jgi:hypothetical protein